MRHPDNTKTTCHRLPIREIQELNADQRFANELQPVNGIDLAFLVENSHDQRYVIVHDIGGNVMAFLTFIDREDHFHLDLVETNRIHREPAQLNPGIALILTLEGMSRTFGFNFITLHSIPERITLYQSLGYVITGEAVYNSDYNMMLTPMTKSFT